MRAHLARHVRLAVCRASAPSCALYATPTRRRPQPRQLGCRTFERTIFGVLFEKPPREVRQTQYEPGWLEIMVWRSRMLENLRPPPRPELVKAWKKLMQFKHKNKVPLNTTQALQCCRLLVYLSETPSNEENTAQLNLTDLDMARKVLLNVDPVERGPEHLKLAEALLDVLSSGNYTSTSKAHKPSAETLWVYRVMSLCRYGRPAEAAQELYANWDKPEYAEAITERAGLLRHVTKALADEGNESELLKLLEAAENRGVKYTPHLQEHVTIFFATRDRIPETQYWFTKAAPSHPSVTRAVASFAVRNHLEDWAKTVLLENEQQFLYKKKEHCDALLQAIILLGYRLDDARAMMSNMFSQRQKFEPDVDTINSLLRLAAENMDRDLAASVLELAEEEAIRTNEETYVILMDLHIALGDVSEVKTAYEKRKYADNASTTQIADKVWTEYSQLICKYLMLLCQQQPTDFAMIGELLSSAEEERVPLTPETVAALCLRFLENDQQFDVVDLLSLHAFGYSDAQRQVVQKAFLHFCMDPATSTSRSWHAYQILQQFFQDLDLDKRTQLLGAFFNRKRPDMATHVFGHMRQHRNKDYHPKADTYISCLEGFAKHPDLEGASLVHNMLKMDTRMQPDRRVYTALMLAYTGCNKPLTALEYWDEIRLSTDGPSYATLAAVFWAFEKKSGGAEDARALLHKLEVMDVDIPAPVYNAYLGAIAGDGKLKEVQNSILKMPSIAGSSPDVVTLGIAYNALPGQQLQEDFQEWATSSYPEIWTALTKQGRRMTEIGLCQFRIDRALKADHV